MADMKHQVTQWQQPDGSWINAPYAEQGMNTGGPVVHSEDLPSADDVYCAYNFDGYVEYDPLESECHVSVKLLQLTYGPRLRIATTKTNDSSPYAGAYKKFSTRSDALRYLFKCQITGLAVPKHVIDRLEHEIATIGEVL